MHEVGGLGSPVAAMRCPLCVGQAGTVQCLTIRDLRPCPIGGDPSTPKLRDVVTKQPVAPRVDHHALPPASPRRATGSTTHNETDSHWLRTARLWRHREKASSAKGVVHGHGLAERCAQPRHSTVLTFSKVRGRWWAQQGSNLRPPACEVEGASGVRTVAKILRMRLFASSRPPHSVEEHSYRSTQLLSLH